MAIEVSGSLIHWNYFLALERDLEEAARFIEFSEANFQTYSIELAHLLLAASSETDVVMKALCSLIAPGQRASNINQYKRIIKDHLPTFITEIVTIDRYGLRLNPWSNWQGRSNPDWWRSYNNVKHQRDDHYSEANLRNVVNSLGALLITVFYFYKQAFSMQDCISLAPRDVTRKLVPESRLLTLKSEYYYSHLIV